jgi:hypothetical protein
MASAAGAGYVLQKVSEATSMPEKRSMGRFGHRLRTSVRVPCGKIPGAEEIFRGCRAHGDVWQHRIATSTVLGPQSDGTSLASITALAISVGEQTVCTPETQ